MRHFYCIALYLLLTLLSLVSANEIDDLIDQANAGNAEAQFKLGESYAQGEGIDKNTNLGIRWMIKAANSDHQSDHQFELGERFSRGEIIPKDENKAFYWHNKAAHGGDLDSQHFIAMMYQEGEFVDKNIELAIKWFLLSAHQGKIDAYYQLGNIYLNGSGVEKDKIKALKYFRLARDKGHEEAISLLQELELSDTNTTQPLIIKATMTNRLSQDAAQGIAKAQYQLGLSYSLAEASSEELILAYKWLSLAAKQHHLDALKQKVKVMQRLSSNDLMKAYKEFKHFKKIP